MEVEHSYITYRCYVKGKVAQLDSARQVYHDGTFHLEFTKNFSSGEVYLSSFYHLEYDEQSCVLLINRVLDETPIRSNIDMSCNSYGSIKNSLENVVFHLNTGEKMELSVSEFYDLIDLYK